LYENSEHQVGQPHPTENEGCIKDRIETLDQNVFTPTEDSLCTDEDTSAVDLSPISSNNHMHGNVDTREDTLSHNEHVRTQEDNLHYLASMRSRVKEQLISSDEGINSISQNVGAIQTLLKSNEEIYNRCRGHIESGTKEKTTFTKANHTVVDAHHDEVTSMFQFVTYPDHCRLEFDTAALSTVPFSLNFGIITFSLEYKSGEPYLTTRPCLRV
jgi:hypothetical protein